MQSGIVLVLVFWLFSQQGITQQLQVFLLTPFIVFNNACQVFLWTPNLIRCQGHSPLWTSLRRSKINRDLITTQVVIPFPCGYQSPVCFLNFKLFLRLNDGEWNFMSTRLVCKLFLWRLCCGCQQLLISFWACVIFILVWLESSCSLLRLRLIKRRGNYGCQKVINDFWALNLEFLRRLCSGGGQKLLNNFWAFWIWIKFNIGWTFLHI